MQGRPAGAEDPAVDLGGLEIGVHLGVDAHQMTGASEIFQTLGEGGVRHRAPFLPRRRARNKPRVSKGSTFRASVQLLRSAAISRQAP